jgi:hypothetical protein
MPQKTNKKDKYIKINRPMIMSGSNWPPINDNSIWRRIKTIKFTRFGVKIQIPDIK